MKVLRVNEVLKACHQSDLSSTQLEVDVLSDGKEYSVVIRGTAKSVVLNTEEGDYFTPSSVEDELTVDMDDYDIFIEGMKVPIWKVYFDEDDLEELLRSYTL